MENQLFTDPMVKPEGKLLEKSLGKKYSLYVEFWKKLDAQDLDIDWNYYNDGKSWLGKIMYKKKNLCWVSIWNTGFKLTFYFTEKTINGVFELDIDEELKKMCTEHKPVGKFKPVYFFVENKKRVSDGFKILEYKKGLK